MDLTEVKVTIACGVGIVHYSSKNNGFDNTSAILELCNC